MSQRSCESQALLLFADNFGLFVISACVCVCVRAFTRFPAEIVILFDEGDAAYYISKIQGILISETRLMPRFSVTMMDPYYYYYTICISPVTDISSWYFS